MTFNNILVENYFEFPRSSIKDIIINKDLSFAFVEIGCKPNRKRNQLKNKRELFYKYWADTYLNGESINYFPEVYRILSHYSPDSNIELLNSKYGLDLIIEFDYLPKEILEKISIKEKYKIIKEISKKDKRRLLEDILMTNNSEKLHKIIVENGKLLDFSNIRGKMTEIITLKKISENMASSIKMYKNPDIKYFNKRYRNGTEIDGILTFYNEKRLIELSENLRKLDYLKIKDIWH